MKVMSMILDRFFENWMWLNEENSFKSKKKKKKAYTIKNWTQSFSFFFFKRKRKKNLLNILLEFPSRSSRRSKEKKYLKSPDIIGFFFDMLFLFLSYVWAFDNQYNYSSWFLRLLSLVFFFYFFDVDTKCMHMKPFFSS